MSLTKKVLARMVAQGAGWVFTPSDFADLGSPPSIGMAMLRLARRGQLRRLARGFYDLPRKDPLLGELLPTADAVIDAIRRRDRVLIEPHEAMAANMLKLSEQVQGRLIYNTDGPPRRFKIGPAVFELRHRSRRKLATPDRTTALVIAALRGLGRGRVTAEHLAHLSELLSPEDRRKLKDDPAQAPAWMRPHLLKIAGLGAK